MCVWLAGWSSSKCVKGWSYWGVCWQLREEMNTGGRYVLNYVSIPIARDTILQVLLISCMKHQACRIIKKEKKLKMRPHAGGTTYVVSPSDLWTFGLNLFDASHLLGQSNSSSLFFSFHSDASLLSNPGRFCLAPKAVLCSPDCHLRCVPRPMNTTYLHFVQHLCSGER